MVNRIAKVFTSEWSVVYTRHCVEQMFERSISEEEISDVLANAREIKNYPEDKPFPAKLVCGYSGSRCLHVVFAGDEKCEVFYVITVYEPDPDKWEEGFLRRKQ